MPEGDRAKLPCGHAFCYPPQTQGECYLSIFQGLRYAELTNEHSKFVVAIQLQELAKIIRREGEVNNCPWRELVLQPVIESLKWLGEEVPEGK